MESDINKLQKSQEQIEKDCRDKVADLEMIVDKLEQKVNDLSLNERAFRDNNEKVLYYTGLSNWNLAQSSF